MAQTSKKHHYLPQFYVAGFTNKDDKVEKGSGKKVRILFPTTFTQKHNLL